jgi:hypothetical protein
MKTARLHAVLPSSAFSSSSAGFETHLVTVLQARRDHFDAYSSGRRTRRVKTPSRV